MSYTKDAMTRASICTTCGSLRPAPTSGTIPANYCHKHDSQTQPANLATIYCRTHIGAHVLAWRLNRRLTTTHYCRWFAFERHVQYD